MGHKVSVKLLQLNKSFASPIYIHVLTGILYNIHYRLVYKVRHRRACLA